MNSSCGKSGLQTWSCNDLQISRENSISVTLSWSHMYFVSDSSLDIVKVDDKTHIIHLFLVNTIKARTCPLVLITFVKLSEKIECSS